MAETITETLDEIEALDMEHTCQTCATPPEERTMKRAIEFLRPVMLIIIALALLTAGADGQTWNIRPWALLTAGTAALVTGFLGLVEWGIKYLAPGGDK